MTTTKPNRKAAAEGQLFFARMARERGDHEAAKAHRELAAIYANDARKEAGLK